MLYPFEVYLEAFFSLPVVGEGRSIKRGSGYRLKHQRLFLKMSAPPVKPKQVEEVSEDATVHKIRITLTSTKVASVEKVCADLKAKALQRQVKVCGPVRMPTKHLKLVVRKSPCGEGTNTWDRWQMRIHKRILDLYAPVDLVKQITSINIEPGVSVEVHM